MTDCLGNQLEEMPNSFLTPWHRTTPPPQEKRDDPSYPPDRPPYTQINLELPIFTLVTLQREKGKRISEDFLMLAQTIRKVSKVHRSILMTNRFLIFLGQEKSTAVLNLAMTHELPQRKKKICRKPGAYVLGFFID